MLYGIVLLVGFVLVFMLLYLSNKKLGFLTNSLNEYIQRFDNYSTKIDIISTNIHELNKKVLTPESKKNFLPFKKEAYQYDSYMEKMRGYFSQRNIYPKKSLHWKIEKLSSDDIHEYVKKAFYINFIEALNDNQIDLYDLKIEEEYSPFPTVYYVNFKLLDYEYKHYECFESIGSIELTLKNNSKKVIKMKSYYDRLTEYYEKEDEYDTIHFFDALKKSYKEFSYETTDSRDILFTGDNRFTFVINELFSYYHYILQDKNIVFRADVEEKSFSARVASPIWSLTTNSFYLLSGEEYDKKEKELIEEYENINSSDLNTKFIRAINIFYEILKLDYKENFNVYEQDTYYQDTAIEIFYELEKKDYPYALLILGVLHYDGKYVLKNIEKSKEYITRAYNSGFEKQAIRVWNDLNYQ